MTAYVTAAAPVPPRSARPTAVLRKFSTSLFRMPTASSVAPSTLSTSAPPVAPTTIGTVVRSGTSCSRRPAAASAAAAARPAAVPSSDIAPDVPGATRRAVVTRNVRRPQALPISLATVSLAPATSAATKRDQRRQRGRRSATPSSPRRRRRRCWRWRCRRPAGRRAPRRCRALPCARRPMRDVTHRRARTSAAGAASPASRRTRRSSCRARRRRRARPRHRSGRQTDGRDGAIGQQRDGRAAT